MNADIKSIVKALELAEELSFDVDSFQANRKHIIDIITKIKNSKHNNDNEYAMKLEGGLNKSADRWLINIHAVNEQINKVGKAANKKLLLAEKEKLKTLFEKAEDGISYMLVAAREVKMFYNIMKANDEYGNYRTHLNQDFSDIGRKGISVRLYQVKRA